MTVLAKGQPEDDLLDQPEDDLLDQPGDDLPY